MSQLRHIVEACGGTLLAGGRRALIPGPDHSAHDRSVSLLETEDGRILIHCFSPKDDWRDVRSALEARGLLAAGEAAPARRSAWTGARVKTPCVGQRRARAERLWGEAAPIAATLAERYLRNRAIAAPLLRSPAFRFHPAMTSLEDRARRPALMSAIHDADGLLQGVEITLLSAHAASKAMLTTPRRVVGALLGGAVRLGQPDSELVIAEGVETAASASDVFAMPAWALLSAHNLGLFSPPAHVRRLLVAIDNDAAGKAAFARLARRLPSSMQLECTAPPDQINDWNDWARRAAHHTSSEATDK